MRSLILTVAVALALLCGCDTDRASIAQCRAIFDRLVVLELEEMGFNDPALTKRKQAELAARYRDELAACIGRRIPPGALACVEAAKDVEIASHDCLR